MLTLNEVVVHYGGVQALKGISLTVEKGCITSLIGANGAGKSTTLKAISGLVPVTSGEIRFEGQSITGLPPEKIVELGIGHVPEGKQLFLEMSVLDNLLTGAHLRKSDENLQQDLNRIYGYFPVLRRARHRRASQLSGGEQQMLAIGRGLMCRPKLLLLDEPSLGLSPILTLEVGSMIKRIADEGVPILLIEQNASLALQLAKRNYVLEIGTIVLEGDREELQDNEHVRAAYLGISPTEELKVAQALASEPASAMAQAQGVSKRPEAPQPRELMEERRAGERPEAPEMEGWLERRKRPEATPEMRPPIEQPREPKRSTPIEAGEALQEKWRYTESPGRWAPEWRSDEPKAALEWSPEDFATRVPGSFPRKDWSYGITSAEQHGLEPGISQEGTLGRRRKEKAAPTRVVKKILSSP